MNKEKIKTFIKDHKKGLIIGAGLTVVGITAAAIGVKWYKALPKGDKEWPFVIFAPTEQDAKDWAQVFEDIKNFRGDAKDYVPIDKEDWFYLTGDSGIISSEGRHSVTGGLIFIKPVVEEA